VEFLLIILLIFGLAYANGANDVSKSVATLVGSGVTNYRTAMAWGTVWTVIGAGTALFIARAMVETFSRGFIQQGSDMTPAGTLAVLAGAMIWVLLASQAGLPVSTTHISSSAIIGIGLLKGHETIRWATVRDMVLTWVVTLPGAALLACLAYLLLEQLL